MSGCCLVTQSCSTLLRSHGLQTHQTLLCVRLPREENQSGFPVLLQGIFPTKGSNLRLLYWQPDSLLLSHLGPCVWYSSPDVENFITSDSEGRVELGMDQLSRPGNMIPRIAFLLWFELGLTIQKFVHDGESEMEQSLCSEFGARLPAPWKLLYVLAVPPVCCEGSSRPLSSAPIISLPSLSSSLRPSSWTDLWPRVSARSVDLLHHPRCRQQERQIGSRHGFPVVVMVSSLSRGFQRVLAFFPSKFILPSPTTSYTELCDSMSTARSHSFVRSSPHNNFLTLYHSMGFCFP